MPGTGEVMIGAAVSVIVGQSWRKALLDNIINEHRWFVLDV
jgi:hypothetical protein